MIKLFQKKLFTLNLDKLLHLRNKILTFMNEDFSRYRSKKCLLIPADPTCPFRPELFQWFVFSMLIMSFIFRLKVRHEAVMRRTLERSQRTRPKPVRWSWGGALSTNTPSTPAGTYTHHTLTHMTCTDPHPSPTVIRVSWTRVV